MATRIERAEAHALSYLEQLLREGTQYVHMRGFCSALVHWVLYGGSRPPGRSELTLAVVKNAINRGLELAFGDAHRHEIPPEVYQRRDSD